MSDCDFCNPMDWSLPGSSAHGSFQARKLEWVDISFSRGSFWPRDQIHISWLAAKFFTTEPPGKVQKCTLVQSLWKTNWIQYTHTHTHTHTYTHTHTLWHNSILMHILNRNANAFIQKLCKDVHSTTLQPNPELKKTQMSKRVKLGNKMWNIHAMEYYTTIKIYKPFVTTWMNLINIMLSERSHTQESIIYYFISVKFKIM